MTVLILSLAFGLLIWALISKNDVVRMIARLFTGLLTLASLAGMVLLFGVGQKAHWTSDGPGMLFIMIGVILCGVFTLIFGSLTLSVSRPDPRQAIVLNDLMTPSPAREGSHAPLIYDVFSRLTSYMQKRESGPR